MRTLLGHALLFVPTAFLVMMVYVAPHTEDAAGVVRLAAKKTVKVVFWTFVLLVAMQVLQFALLP